MLSKFLYMLSKYSYTWISSVLSVLIEFLEYIYITFWNVPLIPLRISYNLLYSFVSILPYVVIIFTFVDSTSLSTNLFMSVLIQSINTIYALSLYLYEICLSYSLLLKKYRSLCVLTHLVNLSAKSHVTNMISNRMWHQPH